MRNNILQHKKLLESTFKKLDWQVIDKNKPVKTKDNDKFSIDYLLKIKKHFYALECKYSHNTRDILSTIFYRVITHIQAICRIKNNNYKPMSLFIVDKANNKFIVQLEKLFNKYAPDVSWIVVTETGGIAYKLFSNVETMYKDWDSNLKITETESRLKLSFSDLELWMFKVLYYSNKNKSNSSKPAANAYQFSKISRVSPRTANNWVNAMKEEGFINNNSYGYLVPVNIEKYLLLWAGRYHIRDNGIHYLTFQQAGKSSLKSLIKKIKAHNPHTYILTGHFACQEYNIKYSSAQTLQFYSTNNNYIDLQNNLGLLISDKETDICVIKPKLMYNIQRSVLFAKCDYVVDYIQLYLDCYHLPDRGYDQAKEILEWLILSNE